ncbi:MAG: flippase-like domain-containing protein [Myxococcaceae bacterium]|nr:flippase-like domain-containing protein [Myxococcaceae bacterium]
MKRAAKLLSSLLVTLLFTWWAFRGTDWAQQWASLRTANYAWVLPYLGVLLAIHLCRTLRWGFLLSGLERVPFRALNEASAIGFMMLLVLPFRLGEFARPFLIAQRSGIRRSAAMTSVVLERIVDGIAVALLLRGLLFFVPGDSRELRLVTAGANVMFAIFGGGLVFLLFALWQQRRAVALVRGTVGRVSPRLSDKVAEIVDAFVGAMRMLPGPAQTAGFFAFTALYWGLNGAGMALLANAFAGCGGADASQCTPLSLTLFQGYVVMCVLVVGVMIPAAPGMMGTFQWATRLGLQLFVPGTVASASGLAYANVLWLCQTLQVVGLGLVMLSVSSFSFRDLAGRLAKEGAPTAT